MYLVMVKPVSERQVSIKQACEAVKEFYDFYEYRNSKRKLPVVRLPIHTPIYRMENYRTRTAQLRYIRDNGQNPDFFSKGQENEAAQQVQHELLFEFAKRGRAESITPIYDELRTETQREPLLITAAGLVVNGNRRLAAMRELFTEDSVQFRPYGYVDCAVLPSDITPDDIREIEVRLQMRPETKLPYGWVDECLAITELLESGKQIDHVADLMKKKKREIEHAVQALSEANVYLREWLKEPGEYELIEDARQIFHDLAKALNGKEGLAREWSRRIAWALIEKRKSLDTRVYDYNFSFGERSDEVLASLAMRLDIDIAEANRSAQPEISLDVDLGDEESETDSSYNALIALFDDPSQRSGVQEQLIAVCENMFEQKKQGEAGRRALLAVQAANSKLQGVELDVADPSTYQTIDVQLDAILDCVVDLKATLQDYLQND